MEEISSPSNYTDEPSMISIQNKSKYSEFQEVQSILNNCNNFFLCEKCKTTPLLQFPELNKINISCKCSINNTIEINNLIQNYVINEEVYNKIQEKKNKCNNHDKNYNYYCKNHNEDMCEECQKEHDCGNNNIINFDAEKPSLENEMIPFIAKSLINRNNDDKSFSMDDNIINSDLLIILISSIIKNYYVYPNYNIIDNIKNFHEKLKNIKNSEKEEFDIQNNKEINKQIEYETLNNDEKEFIKTIKIIAKNNDINIFKKCNLK